MLMKRLVGGYVAMVGIPLLIIVLVLNAGSGLSAPPSIDGAWTIQPVSAKPAGACSGELSLLAGGRLVIAQSGRHLRARWNQDPASVMSGMIDQNRFILCSLGPATVECALNAMHLSGIMLDENGARRLELRLNPAPGGSCQEAVLLSAWREIESKAPAVREYNY